MRSTSEHIESQKSGEGTDKEVPNDTELGNDTIEIPQKKNGLCKRIGIRVLTFIWALVGKMFIAVLFNGFSLIVMTLTSPTFLCSFCCCSCTTPAKEACCYVRGMRWVWNCLLETSFRIDRKFEFASQKKEREIKSAKQFTAFSIWSYFLVKFCFEILFDAVDTFIITAALLSLFTLVPCLEVIVRFIEAIEDTFADLFLYACYDPSLVDQTSTDHPDEIAMEESP